MFVTSDRYPNWKGNILVCSLKFQNIERLEMNGNNVSHIEKIDENLRRVRSVAESPDGYIYVAVEGNRILKSVPVE